MNPWELNNEDLVQYKNERVKEMLQYISEHVVAPLQNNCTLEFALSYTDDVFIALFTNLMGSMALENTDTKVLEEKYKEYSENVSQLVKVKLNQWFSHNLKLITKQDENNEI